jgi:hypothetical protein
MPEAEEGVEQLVDELWSYIQSETLSAGCGKSWKVSLECGWDGDRDRDTSAPQRRHSNSAR